MTWSARPCGNSCKVIHDAHFFHHEDTGSGRFKKGFLRAYRASVSKTTKLIWGFQLRAFVRYQRVSACFKSSCSSLSASYPMGRWSCQRYCVQRQCHFNRGMFLQAIFRRHNRLNTSAKCGRRRCVLRHRTPFHPSMLRLTQRLPAVKLSDSAPPCSTLLLSVRMRMPRPNRRLLTLPLSATSS